MAAVDGGGGERRAVWRVAPRARRATPRARARADQKPAHRGRARRNPLPADPFAPRSPSRAPDAPAKCADAANPRPYPPGGNTPTRRAGKRRPREQERNAHGFFFWPAFVHMARIKSGTAHEFFFWLRAGRAGGSRGWGSGAAARPARRPAAAAWRDAGRGRPSLDRSIESDATGADTERHRRRAARQRRPQPSQSRVQTPPGMQDPNQHQPSQPPASASHPSRGLHLAKPQFSFAGLRSAAARRPRRRAAGWDADARGLGGRSPPRRLGRRPRRSGFSWRLRVGGGRARAPRQRRARG